MWACGEFGRVRHFNGSDWSVTELETPSTLYAIDGTAPDDIWVGGAAGFLAHFDGSTWTQATTDISDDVKNFLVLQSDIIYAVTFNGKLIKYDGSKWETIQSISQALFQDLSLDDFGTVWVCGLDSTIMSYTDNSAPTPTPFGTVTPTPTQTTGPPPSSTPTQTQATQTPTVTRTPDPTETVPPSSTPVPPTSTQVPPTCTPTPTPTGAASPSPTQTAIPQQQFLLHLDNADVTAGENFHLYAEIINTDPGDFRFDAYILLGVYGDYWAWPSWVNLDAGIDFKTYAIPPNTESSEDILNFQWPENTGAASGLQFICGIFEPGTFDLIGTVQVIDWGFH